MSTTNELWKKISDQIGSDLRAVIEYDGVEYAMSLREDLEKQYSELEIQHIVNESIVLQLGVSDRPSGLKAGELNAFMRMYEEAWILSCPHPKKRKGGILVSIDQDRVTATLTDIEQCMGILEETVYTNIE